MGSHFSDEEMPAEQAKIKGIERKAEISWMAKSLLFLIGPRKARHMQKMLDFIHMPSR
ncbi:hypothetical protein [Paenibacillus sp. S02]|uniref:hypothetical protein n=1 Tax=Paenibacillus sp. S02 TaxID=2823904 RepID=UPI001C6497D5|nr:hypothetical protein [Paenibacillus sp. S02]QYK69413.1 hypothetical protein KAI36_04600 [Paenibacillus sp. S02]